MCLVIHIAADRPLSPPFDPEAGGLEVRQLPAEQAGAFRAFTGRHIYAVGFAGACGCEFRAPDGPPRRALVRLLEWALGSVPAVELFVCWEGGEESEPVRRDWATAAELLSWRELGERELLVIQSDS
jgi:hypothetical protein